MEVTEIYFSELKSSIELISKITSLKHFWYKKIDILLIFSLILLNTSFLYVLIAKRN